MRIYKHIFKTPLSRGLTSLILVFFIALVVRLIWTINTPNLITGGVFVDNLPNVLNIPKFILLNILAGLIFIIVVTIFLILRFSLRGREKNLVKKAEKLIEEEHRIRKDIELLMDKALRLSFKYHNKEINGARNILKEERVRPIEDRGDIKIVLRALDRLLSKLPAKEIKNFSKTKYSGLYKKLLENYGVK